MLSLGTIVGLNVPLLPDYVRKDKIGYTQGILQVKISAAFIFSSSGLIELAKLAKNEGQIYFGTAGTMLALAVFLTFGIKDVKQPERTQSLLSKQENITMSVCNVLSLIWTELKTHADFTLAVICATAGKMQSIACN